MHAQEKEKKSERNFICKILFYFSFWAFTIFKYIEINDVIIIKTLLLLRFVCYQIITRKILAKKYYIVGSN